MIEITSEVDPEALAQELSNALDINVAVNVRQPGQVGVDGESLPGVVILVAADSGQLIEVDQQIVESVLNAHEVLVVQTPAETLSAAVQQADSVSELRLSLLAYADKLVEQEQLAKANRQL